MNTPDMRITIKVTGNPKMLRKFTKRASEYVEEHRDSGYHFTDLSGLPESFIVQITNLENIGTTDKDAETLFHIAQVLGCWSVEEQLAALKEWFKPLEKDLKITFTPWIVED